MTDYPALEDQFNERLESMVSALRDFPVPRIGAFSTLHYLKNLLDDESGQLATLRVQVIPAFPGRPSTRMSYDLTSTPKLLQLDHRLMDGFEKVKDKSGDDLPYIIDCFLIHELLHYSQGMGYGR